MARPAKIGLDYFELDCHMDEKVELIEAEFGLKGFAVIVKLYQSIYSGFGYYCEWTPEISVLWAYRLGCTHNVGYRNVGSVCDECALPGFPKNLINEIVAASIRRNIFSAELFDKYRILTSSGIQKRYLNAVSRRENVELKKEYLLISVGKNSENVVIKPVSYIGNSINVFSNTQSRVEKSREENGSYAHSAEARECQSLDDFFESIWNLYPLKKGKGKVSKTKKQVLRRIGYAQIKRCVDRYVAEIKSSGKEKYMMHGSTFFNSGYVDYLDENYEMERPESSQDAELEEDRFSCLDPDMRSILENCGVIYGQSLDLGNATDEQIKYLQECGVL